LCKELSADIARRPIA
ncbi:hypothetical protein, partial [Mycobacterium tuberculosis]